MKAGIFCLRNRRLPDSWWTGRMPPLIIGGEVRTMTLGERIREQRKAKGMSQEMVAGHLGVSRQAVAKWESGASLR